MESGKRYKGVNARREGVRFAAQFDAKGPSFFHGSYTVPINRGELKG